MTNIKNIVHPMKKHCFFSCLIAAAVFTGCIKDDGEPYTIFRQIDTNSTLVSSLYGYMYGNAQTDIIVKDTFELTFNERNIQDLDVYLGLKSRFYIYDTSHIVQCGYVYSYTDNMPTIKKPNCEVFDQITWDSNNNKDSVFFEGEQHKLKFHTDIHIRSFVVTQNGDTCYSPKALTHLTSMPSDVWYQRKDAPSLFPAREGIIAATTEKGKTYFYGGRGNLNCYSDMWIYDVDKDTWEQLATFQPTDVHPYSGPTERCYGAAFMYYNSHKNDTLMYIIGGEDATGEPTDGNFIYSLKNNRFGNTADHPNNRPYVERLKKPTTGLVGFSIDAPNNIGTVHVIGMGMMHDEMSSVTAIETQMFTYNVAKDLTTEDGTNYQTWLTFGSLAKEGVLGDKSAIGYYNSVAVKVNKSTVIIGTGVSSDDQNMKRCGRLFYEVKSNKAGEIVCKQLPAPPEDFVARTNAAGFYLEYNHLGSSYSNFYVGSGVDEAGNLLNDFWAYDLANGTWSRKRDCSNIVREGAVGFSILRVDDLVNKGAEPQQRGIFAFGKGYQLDGESTAPAVRYDVWEYLP